MAVSAVRRKRTTTPAPVPTAALLGGFHDQRGRIILGTPAPAACPFCNRIDELQVRHETRDASEPPMYHVTCETCSADGPIALSRHAAAMLWNQRGVTDGSRLYRLLCGPGEA